MAMKMSIDNHPRLIITWGTGDCAQLDFFKFLQFPQNNNYTEVSLDDPNVNG